MKTAIRRVLDRLAIALLLGTTMHANAQEDPYLWLEDVSGKQALEFVEAQNAHTMAEIGSQPLFSAIRDQVRRVLDSRERIPFATQMGPWLYNFWRDESNPRGLWRRTSWTEYRKAQPAWDIVIDLDALAKREGENWVWSGVSCLPPKYDRCAIRLSRGGGDAVVLREFDTVAKRFVVDGFNLPEAKSEFTWRDRDTAYVATDFGPGSMTESGYPRVVKRWKRGTALAKAVTVFEGQASDVSVNAWVDHSPGHFREGFERSVAFFETQTWMLAHGAPKRVDVPDDASVTLIRDWLVVRLRSDWKVAEQSWRAGSLLAIPYASFERGERKFDVLFEPKEKQSLQNWSATKDALLLDVLDNVKSRIFKATYTNGMWAKTEIRLPGQGAAAATPVDELSSSDFWVTYEDFLTPSTLALAKADPFAVEPLKSLPAFFDAKGMHVEQREAVSTDGTHIPYFVVSRETAGTSAPGPTLLYGYGGFEVTMEPWYSGAFGQAWLARGGTFVLANIRGGGEFGPQWHQAALKSHRQLAYDDFIAVAEDLIKRGTATTRQLGIMGGSNGGLLVGAVMVQRPDLFGAIVCQVPLLDMRRFNKLLAGASWMAEYGNPDLPEDWAAISKYSPYQNVRADVRYPPVLFTTSTRDDRVHPGHARKMVARMLEQRHQDVWYYENTEGGHAGAANNEQRAKMVALEFTFLWQHLGGAQAK